ncbi:triphosphoribosyl-dephospho-CoA synthase [Granulicella cerasi]|uniref:triphosphoribosyl-dephospho-CoA synthase n=1 Tax=Granulicella cerasi TaxID=741063 RepID=A0ABW1Z8J1_9BACT|nr:triphosphoribosyl-dephospho-CoA synthase [Granulicella cerasi]
MQTFHSVAAPTVAWWTPPRMQPAALGALAVEALLQEARATPKPGLVDRRGVGAHHDLSLPLMERSAVALEPHFIAMAEAAVRKTLSIELREELGALGRDAESAMLRVTKGVNTHRGAIWALGLLVAAGAQGATSVKELCNLAGAIARMPDAKCVQTGSHGRSAQETYGAMGARGEAMSGFPHVWRVGVPALRGARLRGASEEAARVDALLAIMAQLEDTCLLHRGGRAALLAAQVGAAEASALGGAATDAGLQRIIALDQELLSLWASPGGSADLLAATLLVDRMEKESKYA